MGSNWAGRHTQRLPEVVHPTSPAHSRAYQCHLDRVLRGVHVYLQTKAGGSGENWKLPPPPAANFSVSLARLWRLRLRATQARRPSVLLGRAISSTLSSKVAKCLIPARTSGPNGTWASASAWWKQSRRISLMREL